MTCISLWLVAFFCTVISVGILTGGTNFVQVQKKFLKTCAVAIKIFPTLVAPVLCKALEDASLRASVLPTGQA
ncbi:hypothetical protein V5799_003799 [Amblyomma americanum]|uniref:Uncharacterized protein n=1 Tax=Amblyomma americanum TaxID=6943 RepID=A0AAQ4D7X9_AMBAM